MHALVLDLDGTLIDTVYAHVFAWRSGRLRALVAGAGRFQLGKIGGLLDGRLP